MKSVRSFHRMAAAWSALLAALLVSGCTGSGATPGARNVIVQGIVLERSNGDLVVLQSAQVRDAVKAALDLTPDELTLLAHAPGTSTRELAPKECFMTVGGDCKPVDCPPKPGCRLWMVAMENGKLVTHYPPERSKTRASSVPNLSGCDCP
jgi:hypothetical protein